jgi:hypothetical protein
LAPSPPGQVLRTVPSAAVSSAFTRLHSQVPLVVAGGRCCPGASRERVTSPCTQDAASRLWLVSGDALGEQDSRKIVISRQTSNYFGVMGISLMITAAQSVNSRGGIAQCCTKDIPRLRRGPRRHYRCRRPGARKADRRRWWWQRLRRQWRRRWRGRDILACDYEPCRELHIYDQHRGVMVVRRARGRGDGGSGVIVVLEF